MQGAKWAKMVFDKFEIYWKDYRDAECTLRAKSTPWILSMGGDKYFANRPAGGLMDCDGTQTQTCRTIHSAPLRAMSSLDVTEGCWIFLYRQILSGATSGASMPKSMLLHRSNHPPVQATGADLLAVEETRFALCTNMKSVAGTECNTRHPLGMRQMLLSSALPTRRASDQAVCRPPIST